jgi:thiol-disulfide isomerase/thioredoxin
MGKSTMKKDKIRPVLIFLGVLASLLFESSYLWSETTAIPNNQVISNPDVGKSFPIFTLPMPDNEGEKIYLGLSGKGHFGIGQIKTQVLLIEIFSFYCPHCQRIAAQVNELYQKLQEDADMKTKLKLIGIGVRNSDYEVDLFRKRYKVLFPLFPDQSGDISEKLDVKGTPTFIAVKLNDNGLHNQFYFEEGGFSESQQFLEEIINLSGLK